MQNKIANIRTTKYLLEKYELLAKRSLGQNFIVDSNIIDRLVAHAKLDKDVAVIEIGPGLGALTQQLIESAGHVTSIEIDQNMIEILEKMFFDKENFTLIHSDILDYDLEALIKVLDQDYSRVMIVANLPYYITSEILLKLFKLENKVDSVMLMVQREFAQRLTADKNTKEYRTLTVLSKTFYDSKIVMKISKHVFYPRPNVDSAIILMKSKNVDVNDSDELMKFVEMCFVQKRKTIYNNLKISLNEDLVLKILKASDIEAGRRASDLDVKDFLKMYEVYYEEKELCKS